MTTPTPTPTCHTCAKPSTPTEPLKRCSRCKTQWYCSASCQKTDWKTHKSTCGKSNQTPTPAAPYATFSTPPRPKNLETFIDKPFHQLQSKTWLHNRPEKDVYTLLIDTYRMKMEDQYNCYGDADEDSVYGGAADSRVGFRRFLKLVEGKKGLLPGWWGKGNVEGCVALGLTEGWSSLGVAAEKNDIIEHYGDASMPMQLRMLGEQIYGVGPYGQPGAEMLEAMVGSEKRQGTVGLINHAAL
ncbi:hypothetical protein BO71DRAFT_398686 [Aspergillus ellipticus CBS 707.79]|uniref:MYND-type domain-containing protein n=1 Tax=Aspergillus ellipticus CBS 707.79 TaxID=1448320 RepID=A0A319DBH5_9EURO|nr:hypothetical protein BO71DRAFT_398686 [Aspergillus ellipticus CBS 707.79]